MKFSPICLFTYNRLSETKKTVDALRNNLLASKSELFIFSDGWKNDSAKIEVEKVRNYLKTIDGFKKITIIERLDNYGLAKSIIEGVSEIINQYGRVIVLEDDLITSKNFLIYMNDALEFYSTTPKVWSISGFSFPIIHQDGYQFDAAFGLRASSWGWASWQDRWDKVDWDVSDYDQFIKNQSSQKRFNLGGSDLCKMLADQMTGKINSWAIRFCYAQFKDGAFDLYPTLSKVESIGFGVDASNTKGMNKRFATKLDCGELSTFKFPEVVEVNSKTTSQFRKPFSIYTRLKYKMLGLLR